MIPSALTILALSSSRDANEPLATFEAVPETEFHASCFSSSKAKSSAPLDVCPTGVPVFNIFSPNSVCTEGVRTVLLKRVLWFLR